MLGYFRAMAGPLRALVIEQLALSTVIALAVATIAALAALVDGHSPVARVVLRAALPAGALLGAASAIHRWRQANADVALGSLGLRPSALLLVAAVVAASAALFTPPSSDGKRPVLATTPDWSIRVGDSKVVFGTPEGELALTFDAAGAHRSDERAPWAGLPPPAGVQVPPPAPAGARPGFALLAPVLVFGLGLRRERPGMGLTLVAASLSLGLGWLLGG